MKKRTGLCCRLILCALLLIGCTAVPSSGSSASASEAVRAGDGNGDSAQGAFSPEDIEQIAIEGTEYTFPLSYDDIQALGWAVSEEGYRLVTSYDVRYVLPMEHETYPGVYLMLYSEYWSVSYDDAQSLEEVLKESGVWGLGVQMDLDQVDLDCVDYPAVSVKGISLGSSLEEVIQTFGEGYDPNYTDQGLYMYQLDTEEEETIRYYWLYFSFQDGKMYELHAAICY